MSKITNILFLLLFLTAQVSLSSTINLVTDKRIVGGEIVFDNSNNISSKNTTAIEQWPWVVALKSEGAQFCGASLIDRQWLLTAAHCIYDPFSESVDSSLEIEAVFLQSNLSETSSQSFSRTISKIHIHPDYNYDLDINDIALLKLNTLVDNIAPVQLSGSSYAEFIIPVNTRATVLGWGKTQDRTDNNIILRKVELPVVEQSICSESLAKNFINIEDSMICAGYPEGGKDACSGDSGGPLVYFSESLQNWLQIGIVSFGIGCALPDEYGVYTRITKYTQPQQLINSTICETQPEIPDLQITQEKQTIKINFSTQALDHTFRLYYAPYPLMTPIHYLDILSNEFEVTLLTNETYFIAVQTRNINCISDFSDIHVIN